MKNKIFHGDIDPQIFARALIAEFNHGNLQASQTNTPEGLIVQIATRAYRQSGGQTGLTVSIGRVEDGVAIQTGDQSMFGVAASLGTTALAAIRNPLSLLGRLDDVAQDIESMQLEERVWDVVEKVAQAAGASLELSERLRRLVCAYCDTANPTGEPSCIACGAPLGDVQPTTCPNCGFVVRRSETVCPNCKEPL
ncbi:MAG: zinc ribbon domain-containing protein [Chloroflexi bacterium]|nr:zinc ribbon domain-containing protein [Chloroflexota bacterium]